MIIRSPKILAHARGKECQIRIPGVCNRNPETTVACHLPSESKGMGIKSDDIFITFGCSACHKALDEHLVGISAIDRMRYMFHGMQRTWKLLIEDGLILYPVPTKSLPKPTFPIEKPPKKKRKGPKRTIQSKPFKHERG